GLRPRLPGAGGGVLRRRWGRARTRPPRCHAHGRGDHGRHGRLPRAARLRRTRPPHARGHAGRHHGEGADRARGDRSPRRHSRGGRRRRGGHAMSVYLAITRADVADYISTLTVVYLVLIFIRILTSWIPRMPYNRFLSAFLQFVSDVTDPYLNLFRRFLPMVRMGPGALDLSPIVATIVLILVSGLVTAAIRG